MNYQYMTDFEINQLVGSISGEAKSSEPNLSLVIRSNGKRFDPCNSWADAGPIAHQNKINIYFSNNEKMAEHRQTGKKSITCTDCNPCRAICIVFLIMMKGGE